MNHAIFKMADRIKNREYQLQDDRYFRTVKFLDILTGVKKEVKGDYLVYSPAEPNPDLKVRAITNGHISVDNNQRMIILSNDIRLANGLEEKLIKLILIDN